MEKGTIHFNELSNLNDSNSLVMTALSITEEGTELPEIAKFFEEESGIATGKHLLGVYRILDNVLGDEGRTDWVAIFDNPDIDFNAAAKRGDRAIWVKWTSDFIDNYKNDFISGETA